MANGRPALYDWGYNPDGSPAFYPAGSPPWNSHPVVTTPAYRYFTPGVPASAQEMNSLLSRNGGLSPVDILDFTGNDPALQWTPALSANAMSSGFNAWSAAAYDPAHKFWMLAANASFDGSGLDQLQASSGFGDLDGDNFPPGGITAFPFVAATGGITRDLLWSTTLGLFLAATTNYMTGNLEVIQGTAGGTWTLAFSDTTANFKDVRLFQDQNATIYVVATAATKKVIYYNDGVWHGPFGTSASGGAINSVTAFNGIGQILVMPSASGFGYDVGNTVTWTAQTDPFSTDIPTGLAYAADHNGPAYFATCIKVAGTQMRTYRSADGIAWTLQSTVTTFAPQSLAAIGSLLCCLTLDTGNGNQMLYSFDGGMTWFLSQAAFRHASTGGGIMVGRVVAGETGFAAFSPVDLRFSANSGHSRIRVL